MKKTKAGARKIKDVKLSKKGAKKVKGGAARAQCTNNLKQLGLG